MRKESGRTEEPEERVRGTSTCLRRKGEGAQQCACSSPSRSRPVLVVQILQCTREKRAALISWRETHQRVLLRWKPPSHPVSIPRPAGHRGQRGGSRGESTLYKGRGQVLQPRDGREELPNGQNASPVSPFPHGLPSWKNGSSLSPGSTPSPSSWRGVSPDTPSPKGVFGFLSLLTRSLLSSPICPSGELLPSSAPVSTVNKSFSSNLPLSLQQSLQHTRPNLQIDQTRDYTTSKPFPCHRLKVLVRILSSSRPHYKTASITTSWLCTLTALSRRPILGRVLQRAKALFADSLQSEVWDSEEGDEVSSDSPTTVPCCSPLPPPPPPGLFLTPLSSPHNHPLQTPPINLADTIPSPSSP
ncbi:unnamed protein product, partial [Coregonus sp. 'balchen']